MEMIRKKVNVDDLFLWTKNPRVVSAQGQLEEVNNIYNLSAKNENTSHRQLMNLATSIAENGYQNEIEPILVEQQDDKLVVLDANRRITCIKILNDPDSFRMILTNTDYNKVYKLRNEFKNNIPTELEIVLLVDTTEEEISEILARKHNGPLNGAGTIPWDAQAKDRYFNRNKSFADKLDSAFEEQYGQRLTSYLGGSQSVTSTRRIFNSTVIKNYLTTNEVINPKVLDKAKEIADQIMEYCDDNNLVTSRLRKNDFQQVVDNLTGSKRKNNGKINTHNAFTLEMQKYINNVTESESHLGSKWLNKMPTDYYNEYFEPLELMLIALAKFGVIDRTPGERYLKAVLLSPSIRVIFELAILGFQKSLNDDHIQSPSKKHKENVEYIHTHLSNDGFINYLVQTPQFQTDTYLGLQQLIRTTTFENDVQRSQLTSHKSGENLTLDEICGSFNNAVLFAILCELFVMYKNDETKC